MQVNKLTVSRFKLILFAICISCGVTFYVWQHYQRQQIAAQFSSADLMLLRQTYEKSQDIIAELQLIHDKKGIRLHRPKSYAKTRQIRHAWHKTHAILMEINHLNEYKGLQKVDLPKFEEHISDLQDIDNMLATVMAEILSLKHVYSVSLKAKPNNTNSLILPINLYQNIHQITRMISALERSEGYVVAPTHVYRIAKTIVSELQKIEGIKVPKPYSSSGKRPRDVYNQAHILMRIVQELSRDSKYNITGGVVLLEKDGGHIIPSDVFNILVNILADIEAIRHTTGDITPLKIAPTADHKTPSDVFDKVSEAVSIVESML